MPPLPPKPTIGPLVRRTLFAAALGAGACGPGKPQPVRIGAYEPRIGAHVPPPEYDVDAAVPVPQAADAGVMPDPIRIGPPVRIGMDPGDDGRSSLIRGVIEDERGRPLARTSLRIALPSGARIVATDAAGRFQVDGLPPGEYAAVVEAGDHAPVAATLTSSRKPVVARLIARR
jgi:hypothetical protein